MDFDLPRDLADWQRRVRAFVAAELTPHDAAIEKTGVIPPSALDGLRRMGLYGLNTPKPYGGLGLTMLGTCLALQELAKAHIAYYYVSGVNVHIGSKGIEFDGTEAQRRRWLPELASGRIVASFALTEPGAGSDAGGIATTAVRDGGHYVLNGRKIYITNAPVAGLFTVFARTRSDNPRGAISAFLVEAGTPGLEIGEVDRDAGRQRLGPRRGDLPGLPHSCRQSAGRSRGPRLCHRHEVPRRGPRVLGRLLRRRGGAPARARRRPRHDPQAVRRAAGRQPGHRMADRRHVREPACGAARFSRSRVGLRHQAHQRTARSALAKYVGADMVFRVADATLQMFGGSGYAKSLPVERIWREVRVVRILDGTSEIMRKIIAREVLGQGDAG